MPPNCAARGVARDAARGAARAGYVLASFADAGDAQADDDTASAAAQMPARSGPVHFPRVMIPAFRIISLRRAAPDHDMKPPVATMTLTGCPGVPAGLISHDTDFL
jgi:hypothetical protein